MRVIVDRRMLKDPPTTDQWGVRVSECAECGKVAEEATVELGDHLAEKDYDWTSEWFCLPCLKRAVAEAEAAVAKDKA